VAKAKEVPEPAVARHARKFYAELESRARPDGNGNMVATVYITALYSELGVSPGYQVRVREILFDSNPPCAVVARQGAGGHPSVIFLLHPPTEGNVEEALTGEISRASLSVGQIEERVRGIEARLGTGLNIVEALRNHERRIATLETAVAEVGLDGEQGENANGKD